MSRIISNIFIVSCPLSFGLPFQHTMQVPFFLNLVFLKGKLHGRSGRNVHFGFPCQRICGWEHRYRLHRMATLTFGHGRHIVFFPQHTVKVEAVVLSAARYPIPPPRGGDDLQKPEVFFSWCSINDFELEGLVFSISCMPRNPNHT